MQIKPQTRGNWLMLCNAQSIFYKIDEMRALATVVKPVFICVTETWLTPNIVNDLLSIRGYTIFRNDRRDDTSDSRRGGGTLIYASHSVMPSNIDIDIACKPKGIEYNIIKFCDPHVSYLMCIYIPPSIKSEYFEIFENLVITTFDSLLNITPNANIYVCGDLNRYDFSFLTRYYDLSNIVNEPTFANAILDKVFCKTCLMNDFNAVTLPSLGVALHAHKIVLVSKNISSVRKKAHIRRVLDLRQSHVNSFCKSLLDADWSSIYNSNDLENCVTLFYDFFSQAMSAIPVSYVKITDKTKPWVTPVLLDLINKRWKAFRNKQFFLYQHYKAKVKEEILKSKRIWSSKMCQKPKGVWTVVNEARGTSNVSSTDQIVSLFANPFEAAESINNLFSKSFVKCSSFPFFNVDNSTIPAICDEELVYFLLSRLKTTKSPGSDGIYPYLLKVSASVLCKPLSFIFNLSFSRGIVPTVWKLADVCPIPKVTPITRDKFRPISLLPVISKLMEEIVLRRYRHEFVSCYDPAYNTPTVRSPLQFVPSLIFMILF